MAKDLSLKAHGGTPSDVAEILEKPISQEMLNRDLTRLAYVAHDGTPRVIPIAFTWNGTEVVMAPRRTPRSWRRCAGTPPSPSPSTPRCTHRRSCCSGAARCSTKSRASPTSTSR